MEKFLVFFGSTYYPSGGWNDFRASFNDSADAIWFAKNAKPEVKKWWHVVDSELGKIIAGECWTLWGKELVFDIEQDKYVEKNV